MSHTSEEKKTALEWIDRKKQWISDFDQLIWSYAEPGLREYKSARAYCKVLRDEGFHVLEGTGGMPTAFLASWGEGKPVLASFAEYDAVPENNQAATPYKKLRDENLHPYAAGHTDPHSALGVTALAGILGAKAAMETRKLKGTLKFFGEPAEKICISKPYHAAKGYYNDLDACILYHPRNNNTVNWETHAGAYWNTAYTFEADRPEEWRSPAPTVGWYRSFPGALDAVCLMYTTTKYTKEAMHARTAGWTLTEFITIGGQSTTAPPLISQIDYAFRSPTLQMQERIHEFLKRNAKTTAEACGCRVTERIVTKTRVGLHNKTMAELAYRNLELAGPTIYGEDAKKLGREIQKNLGHQPMDDPFTEDCQKLTLPEQAEAGMRRLLPAWAPNYSSDDYVEYTWHAPCARIYTAKATLRPYPNSRYPSWTSIAMAGMRETIDPMILTGAKAIAMSLVELLTSPSELAKAQEEFRSRTGGGIGGTKWVPPLLPPELPPPVDMRWPEYVTTERGQEWWIPTPRGDQS